MQNPLESEEAAFRFVLGAIVYFAPIVVAAWIATWLGVIVFVVMSVLAFVVLRRGTASVPPRGVDRAGGRRGHAPDPRRHRRVARRPGACDEAIVRLTATVTEDVLLICAVAPSAAEAGSRWWRPFGDGDQSEELEAALHELRAAGINARGSLAVRDPLQALEDALRGFDADEVVLSITTTVGRPTAGADALEPSAPPVQDVAEAARSHFDGPVTAIVDDDPP